MARHSHDDVTPRLAEMQEENMALQTQLAEREAEIAQLRERCAMLEKQLTRHAPALPFLHDFNMESAFDFDYVFNPPSNGSAATAAPAPVTSSAAGPFYHVLESTFDFDYVFNPPSDGSAAAAAAVAAPVPVTSAAGPFYHLHAAPSIQPSKSSESEKGLQA